MLARNLNSPRTSSVGRLFDAVTAILGIRQVSSFEGQAALELEYSMSGIETDDSYPVHILRHASEEQSTRALRDPEKRESSRTMILDWEPMIIEIVADLARRVQIGFIATKFHNTLVESLVTIAGLAGEPRICLSGGCFQNRYLVERSIRRLRDEGYHVYWHQRVPPHDGGIALGQAVAAARYLKQN